MDALDDQYREDMEDSEPEEILSSGPVDAPGDEILENLKRFLQTPTNSLKRPIQSSRKKPL